MSTMDRSRFSGIFAIPDYFKVVLIGAGGIGATTALTLAKMGVMNLVVIDDDVVSVENTGTQLHHSGALGEPKAWEIERLIGKYADDVAVLPFRTRLNEEMEDLSAEVLSADVVISAVDSIGSRQGIWQALKSNNVAWKYYIDARMAAEEFQALVVHFRQAGQYEETLMALSEDDVPDLPCTEKATFYTAMIAAGHLGALIKMIVINDETLPARLVHNIQANTLFAIGSPDPQ